MNMRNRRAIEYGQQHEAISGRNRIDAIYALSGPYKLPYNPKNPPPAPEWDPVRDALGALMVEIDEVSRYGSV